MEHMNDENPSASGDAGTDTATDREFDARRLRSITDMQRSTDDALLGGVSTGAARHLDVDPVVVRIGFVILTFLGGAGIVLYLAAWLFLPSDRESSYAQQWFNLDEFEERVRVGGLVVAAAVAALSIVGDIGWGWGGGPGWIVPALVLLVLIVVLPRRRRAAAAAAEAEASEPTTTDATARRAAPPAATAPASAPHDPRSPVLLGLTVSIVAIAMAVVRLVADANGGTDWTTYVAVALTIVGVAVLVSTFWGDGGSLIGIGLALATALAVGSFMPSLRMGDQFEQPSTAAAVDSSYTHGAGNFELDLTAVDDVDALLGRTIDIETGMGETTVIVPADLNVAVDSSLHAGEIRLLDQKVNGTQIDLDLPAEPGRRLTIDVEHQLGTIEVIRR